MSNRSLASLSLVALFAASPALAFPQGSSDGTAVVKHIFEQADTDKSGALSAQEYKEAGLHEFGVSFEDSDTNDDGETSLVEYLALYERHHSKKSQI